MVCTGLSLLHLPDVKLLSTNLVGCVSLALFSVDPQRAKHLGLMVCTPEALRIMWISIYLHPCSHYISTFSVEVQCRDASSTWEAR